MSLKVCCVSDLHGRLPKIPECDVLVIAGDVAPDSKWFGRVPVSLYAEEQRDWFDAKFREWETSVVKAPFILAIPGNHDWYDFCVARRHSDNARRIDFGCGNSRSCLCPAVSNQAIR